jgi:hypothetical protein
MADRDQMDQLSELHELWRFHGRWHDEQRWHFEQLADGGGQGIYPCPYCGARALLPGWCRLHDCEWYYKGYGSLTPEFCGRRITGSLLAAIVVVQAVWHSGPNHGLKIRINGQKLLCDTCGHELRAERIAKFACQRLPFGACGPQCMKILARQKAERKSQNISTAMRLTAIGRRAEKRVTAGLGLRNQLAAIESFARNHLKEMDDGNERFTE